MGGVFWTANGTIIASYIEQHNNLWNNLTFVVTHAKVHPEGLLDLVMTMVVKDAMLLNNTSLQCFESRHISNMLNISMVLDGTN